MEHKEVALLTSVLSCGTCLESVRTRAKASYILFCMKHGLGWRSGILPKSTYAVSSSRHTNKKLHFPPGLLERAISIQRNHDTKMHHLGNNICNTPPISTTRARSLLSEHNHPFSITRPLTVGGISRIFETDDDSVLVKFSLDDSYGKWEPIGYGLLTRHAIPSAKVLDYHLTEGYLILVLERLPCSLSAILQSISALDVDTIESVVGATRHLLHMLFQAGLSFTDLGPDNIMYDPSKKQLKLIDPQFLVPVKDLSARVGEKWGTRLDTSTLCLRIYAIGMVHVECSHVCQIVSRTLLQQDLPPTKHQIKWLTIDLRMFLNTAFKILGEKKFMPVWYEQIKGKTKTQTGVSGREGI